MVVNYGSHLLLTHNLVPVVAEIRSSTKMDLMVVVVDNFTSMAERECVVDLARLCGFEVVALDKNHGFGGGVNRGVAYAFECGATEVLLINPDATIDSNSLAVLVDYVRNNPMDVAAPLIRRPDGAIWSALMDLYLTTGQIRGARFRPSSHASVDVLEWVSGACMVLTATLWSAVGGFDESYFMYWEDVEFCQRVVDAGGRCVSLSEASAIHEEGGTQPRNGRRRSSLFYYFNARNRLRFASQHVAPDRFKSWKRESWRNARRMLGSEGKRVLMHPQQVMIPLARGEWDGRRELRAMKVQ